MHESVARIEPTNYPNQNYCMYNVYNVSVVLIYSVTYVLLTFCEEQYKYS
jgi:hypothetical protein